MDTYSSVSVLQTYVRTLVEHDYESGKLGKCFASSNSPSSVPEIDLVLDGGAFNGGYTLGALMYVKYAESRGYLRVCRISGCSVGACVGLTYRLNKLEEMISILTKFMDLFRKKSNMTFYKQFVTEFVDLLLDEEGLKKCQNNLYISCFNKNKEKQIVVSSYPTKEDLLLAILRTIYIPFLSNDSPTDTEGYVDGGYPHLFRGSLEVKGRKQMYIQLNGIDKILNMIHIKSENSIVNRMTRGLEDIRTFVQRSGEPTFMCSFVEKWNPIDSALYNSKPFFCNAVLSIYHFLNNYYSKIPITMKSKVNTLFALDSSSNAVDAASKLLNKMLEHSISKIV